MLFFLKKKQLLLSLKRLNESYIKVVIEFTHKDVIQEVNNLLNVTTSFGKGKFETLLFCSSVVC